MTTPVLTYRASAHEGEMPVDLGRLMVSRLAKVLFPAGLR